LCVIEDELKHDDNDDDDGSIVAPFPLIEVTPSHFTDCSVTHFTFVERLGRRDDPSSLLSHHGASNAEFRVRCHKPGFPFPDEDFRFALDPYDLKSADLRVCAAHFIVFILRSSLDMCTL
jgi:hypothetical protein